MPQSHGDKACRKGQGVGAVHNYNNAAVFGQFCRKKRVYELFIECAVGVFGKNVAYGYAVKLGSVMLF